MTLSRSVTISLVAFLVVVSGCAAAAPAVATEGANPGLTDTPTDAPTAGSANASLSNATEANGTLEVHFINVGQSSSILLVDPSNETMLIDTGDWRDDGKYVLRYLRVHNVTRIDHLVTSHADADHIGGHAAVIEYYETRAEGVGAVYDPGVAASSQTYERYLDAVEEHNVTLYRASANDSLPFGNVSATVLAPPEESLAGGQRNENSLVLAVEHGGHEFLFPGDGEEVEESYLVETYGSSLDATLLAVGHHGSRTSTTPAFLNATNPRVAVISSAYDSQYGHPHEETLDRLGNRSTPTYWTATHGTVVLTSDGLNLTVSTQRSATTNATAIRSSPPVDPGANGTANATEVYVASGDAESNNSTREPTETPQVVTDGGTAAPTERPSPADPTETATPVPEPSGSASGSLSLVRVHEDATGGDERDVLGDEYLVFENTGDAALDLTGWTVRDEVGHAYRFPDGFTLDPGARVTLRTGGGTDTATDLYWGSGSPVWNNGGDTVVVTAADGTVVVEESY